MKVYNLNFKNLGLLFGILILSQGLFAQKSKRTNTHFALQEAREALVAENFAEAAEKLAYARENIDAAVQHEQTSGEAKTWVYRGDVYSEILRLPAEHSAGVPKIEAAKLAVESFKKAISLDDSKRQDDAKDAQSKLNNVVYVLTFNHGLQAINEGKNEEALKAFEVAIMINEKDTNAALNAAISAERMEDYDKAMELYTKMVNEMGASDHIAFVQITNTLMKKEKYDEALAMIQKGIEVNKNASAEKKKLLRDTEFNIYLVSNKLEEAVSNVKANLENDPNDDALYARLGQLYDQMGQNLEDSETDYNSMAIENYKKALELNPDNFDANYNMGANLTNKGVELQKVINNMNLNEYKTKGKKMEEQANAYFNESIPYFKKVLELDPENSDAKKILYQIYSNMKNYEEAEKYKE